MLNDLATINQIRSAILAAEKILIVGHPDPDADALGSIVSFGQYLKSLNKSYQLFSVDLPAANYQFLPHLEEISNDQAVFVQDFDLVIVCDSGDLDYAGIKNLLPKISVKFKLINIDHHDTNNYFGDLNLVEKDMSSTSEIIYHLLKVWRFPITKEVATLILNGLVGDTNMFSNPATTFSALNTAGHLLNLGARHKEINHNFLRNKNLNMLKIWGRAFERLQFNAKYNLAFTVLSADDFKELETDGLAVSGLSNFFCDLAGAKASLVLMEHKPGEIKGSFRTVEDDVDVARLARALGGGGHKKAAGFTAKGRLVYNNHTWQITD